MGTIDKTSTSIPGLTQTGSVVKWAGLTTNDVGVGAGNPSYHKRSVQVEGNFGGGATATMQGSNDGTNWRTLNDVAGNALTFTAAGIKMVAESTLLIRPSVTSGTTPALDITLLMTK